MAENTPLVLLHFFGSSQREWEPVRAWLSSGRCVLALDLPGFGDAAERPSADVDGMADGVERAVVAASPTSCVLVGHSMSQKVAAVLAARAPARVRELVLTTVSPPSREPMGDAARDELLAFDGGRDATADYIEGITASWPA